MPGWEPRARPAPVTLVGASVAARAAGRAARRRPACRRCAAPRTRRCGPTGTTRCPPTGTRWPTRIARARRLARRGHLRGRAHRRRGGRAGDADAHRRRARGRWRSAASSTPARSSAPGPRPRRWCCSCGTSSTTSATAGYEWKLDALQRAVGGRRPPAGLHLRGRLPPGDGLQGPQPRHRLVRDDRRRLGRALRPAYDAWLDPANFDDDGRQRTSLSTSPPPPWQGESHGSARQLHHPGGPRPRREPHASSSTGWAGSPPSTCRGRS